MLRFLQKILVSLQPQTAQRNKGQGSVQAAEVAGDVHVHNIRTTHVHLAMHHPDATVGAGRSAAPQQGHTGALSSRKARPDQAGAVRQYKQLTPQERGGVSGFMLREFKTSTILDLDEGQVFRLMKYMEKCLEGRPKTKQARGQSPKPKKPA